MDLIPFQKPSRAALLIICLALGACSPYVYKDEVATFGQGVDASVQAFQSLMPQYTAWATEQRDKQLLREFESNQTKPSVFDGCEVLRREYLSRFAKSGASAGDLLTVENYAACHVTPVPRTDPDEGLPNLTALGVALKSYAAGLAALTNSEDEAAVQSAFGQLNTSAKSLLTSVNEELSEKNEATLDAVGALVYQVGLTYLRQRRFDALKQAVNDNDHVVGRAADLLAEGAFNIYNPTLTAKKAALNEAENKAVSVTAGDFVTVWSNIDKARDAYVKAFQDSPIYAFANIKATHTALRDSVNNPANRAQLDALHENAVALKKAAEAALEAVRNNDGGGS